MEYPDYLLQASARTPLLTPLQEVILGRRIRAWQDWPDGPDLAPKRIATSGKRALDRFVLSNIRLAFSVARRYQNRGVPLEDLTQAAIEGMIAAYRKFRPDLGYRSSSYAVWYAKQSCQLAIARQGMAMRLPQQVVDQLTRIALSREVLERKQGRPPTEREWAKQAGLTTEKFQRLRELARRADLLELDRPLPGRADQRNPSTLGQMLAAPNTPQKLLERTLCRERLEGALATIADLQVRAVLFLLHLSEQPFSPVRIAQMLNISARAVVQMEHQGLAHLRSQLEGECHEYLELLEAA